MAQYFWDANDYAENAVPADFGWTLQAGTPTVSRIEGTADSRYWRESKTTDSTRNYSWDAVPASDNIEVFCDIRVGVTSFSNAGRWNGILTMNFPPHGYRFTGDGYTGGNTFTAIFEFSGGAFVARRPVNSDSQNPISLPLSPFRAFCKAQRNGGTLKYKIWTHAQSEPGWLIEASNGGITGNVLAGWGG